MVLFRHYAVLWNLLNRREKCKKLSVGLLLAGVCFVLIHAEGALSAGLNAWMASLDSGAVSLICWLLHGLVVFLHSHDLIARHPPDQLKDQLIFYRTAGFTPWAYLLLQFSRFLPTVVFLFFLHRFLFQWAPTAGAGAGMSIGLAILPLACWLLLSLRTLHPHGFAKTGAGSLRGSWRFSSRGLAQLTYYLSNPFLRLFPILSATSLLFVTRVTNSSIVGILFPGWLACFFVLFAHSWNERHAPFLKLMQLSRGSLRRTYVLLSLSILGGTDSMALLFLFAAGTMSPMSFFLSLSLHLLHLFLLSWAASTLVLAYFPERKLEEREIAVALFAAPAMIVLLVPFYFLLFLLLLERRIREPMDWSACPHA